MNSFFMKMTGKSTESMPHLIVVKSCLSGIIFTILSACIPAIHPGIVSDYTHRTFMYHHANPA